MFFFKDLKDPLDPKSVEIENLLLYFEALTNRPNMKYVYLFILFLVAITSSAQDKARLYLFRDSKFAGSIVGYDVYLDSVLIGRVTSGSVLTYSASPGLRTIKAKTEGESSITIDLKAGGTYYVEWGIELGVVAGRPSFRQVSASEAKAAISKINPQIAIAPEVDPQFATDTARALSNMFSRKRKGGVTRATIFSALTIASIAGTAAQSGSNSKINGVTIDNGPNPANYVFIGIGTIVTITGFTQASKYNSGRLTQLTKEYKEGKGIPKEFKSKLKAKDFK